jgi:Fic family protein
VTLSDDLLAGTPYLIAHDEASQARFTTVRTRAVDVRRDALAVAERVEREASEVMDAYKRSIRADLVAESNKIEGYPWSAAKVAEAVKSHLDLVLGPSRLLLDGIRNDRHLAQALGLFKAESIAEELTVNGQRLREYEIRSLHELIAAGEGYAGRYKRVENQIAGSSHRTSDPLLVSREMGELVEWWRKGSSDPALDAAIVHAWLTHIHPFDDGNGRLARLLANITLIQSGYPALMVRADPDRGKYLEVLARSDEGDILPFYDFVVDVVRRTVRVMSREDYVGKVISGQILKDDTQRHRMWRRCMSRFTDELSDALDRYDWRLHIQGYPDRTAFQLLEDSKSEGNSWYAKVRDANGKYQYLLWFGYLAAHRGRAAEVSWQYPAIFISIRDEAPSAVYPWRELRGGIGALPLLVVVAPLVNEPVKMFLAERHVRHMEMREGARALAECLVDAAGKIQIGGGTL